MAWTGCGTGGTNFNGAALFHEPRTNGAGRGHMAWTGCGTGGTNGAALFTSGVVWRLYNDNNYCSNCGVCVVCGVWCLWCDRLRLFCRINR